MQFLLHTFRRARQERLPQIAGSLAFATVLSAVPLLGVSYVLFTRYPVLRHFRDAIEAYLLRSLLPPDIAQPVLRYLHQFAVNAGGLTLIGLLFLVVAAVALLLTIENAFNQIWGVKRNRPFLRRVGLYLVMLAVGPPVVGASLWATSTAIAASAGWLQTLPPAVHQALSYGPVLLGTLAMAALFHAVPNTRVPPWHALVGGLIAAVAFESGKRAFAAYLIKVPTYQAVYGAFAVLPVFLLWVYLSWLVTLAAALLTSSLGRVAPKGAGKPR